MSLVKIFKVPIKLFRKDVITFVLIRRYDLGILDKKLHYISVKPSASVTVLRHKIWFVLDLPDYCDEVIVLKSSDDKEIPLTELRKGNDPEHPYFLEVWPPSKKSYNTAYKARNNLLTIGNGEIPTESITGTETIYEDERKHTDNYKSNIECSKTISNETPTSNNYRVVPNTQPANKININYKKSDVSCKISTMSFFTLNRRKSRDNFINVLLKMQHDLSALSNKLSNLETKISV